MTRGQILEQAYRRLSKSTTPDAQTEARLLGFLNETYREVLSWPGMQRLRDDTLTFLSVANQARYALPWVAKVNRIFETTNDRVLRPMLLADYRAINPDPASAAGVSSSWIWDGYAPVAVQPSSAASLWLKSTAAGDTMTVSLSGETAGGYPRRASVGLTGAAAINLDGAVNDWVRVSAWSLSAAATGSVTLHQGSGIGTELARVSPGLQAQRYVSLYLYPTPSSVVGYSADVVRGVLDLATDGEEPIVPSDFHDVLVAGVMVREYEKLDDARLSTALQRFHQRKRDLIYWLHETADSPWQSSGAYGRPSSLGPWFPTGT